MKKAITLATVLRVHIDLSGKSIAQLARDAGIAQPVLHRFAKGERDLTLRTAAKLADYLGLELRPRRRR